MIYRFGAFAIDVKRLELTAGGKPVAVQPQVFAVLGPTGGSDKTVRPISRRRTLSPN